MEHFPHVTDSRPPQTLEEECRQLVSLDGRGDQISEMLRNSPGFAALREKCAELGPRTTVYDSVVGDPRSAEMPMQWGRGAPQPEPLSAPPFAALPFPVGQQGFVKPEAPLGLIQMRKCALIKKAKQRGGKLLRYVKNLMWFDAMERKCGALAMDELSRAPPTAMYSPAPLMAMPSPEPPHFAQGDGAWNWQALAGGLQQMLGDEGAGPASTFRPDAYQAPDMQKDMQNIVMQKMGEAVLQQKCVWLEQQVQQLAMVERFEQNPWAAPEDEGKKKLRDIAAWAQKQPWFGMLRTKCNELAVAAAQSTIHV